MDCGRWNSDGEWLGKYLGNVRVKGCTDAVWPLPRPLMCELFPAIERETTDALTSPRATSILPVPTMGNNSIRVRNSWKYRPLKRGFKLFKFNSLLSSSSCFDLQYLTKL
ncbi:hypothetical protein AVEN_237691-1 [Araneus ventricosus]|uniref:Uncharacterized protein n=1 Tax=Araneus ventricosus TaxID=182803 RepID=A0A4Y2EMI0_ARAVE|nr:hypothetical protein AVEN_237691-1 [Araneus ventricosus]